MARSWLRRRAQVTSARIALLVTSMSVVSFSAPAKKAPAPASAPAPEAALPPAPLTLKVTPGTTGDPWRMQIENTGEGPVRIPADPRLLVLELTPGASSANAPASAADASGGAAHAASETANTSSASPSATPSPATTTTTTQTTGTARAASAKGKKPTAAPTPARCILPDDARPSTDEGRELVIPAKRSWSATFDPLFYCFGARERAALVPGTSVKARFGWPAAPNAKKAPAMTPPFAATPVGASVGKVAPVNALEADAFVLGEGVSIVSSTRANGKGASDEAASSNVTLTVPETMDAARGAELTTTVTLTNGSDRPIVLLYRPDMIQFNVTGPAGSVTCGLPKTVASPIRELFITVPVKGRADTSVLFTTTCPPGTFDEPGVYRVLPRLDTTNASGRALGMKTWDGLAVGKAPLLLRVRSQRKPTPLARPTLD